MNRDDLRLLLEELKITSCEKISDLQWMLATMIFAGSNNMDVLEKLTNFHQQVSQLNNDELAKKLLDEIWADLLLGTIEEALVFEAIERLRNKLCDCGNTATHWIEELNEWLCTDCRDVWRSEKIQEEYESR